MLKIKKKLLISSMILASALSGCSTIPNDRDITTLNKNDVNSKIKRNETWSQDPSIQIIYSNTGTQILKRNSIPNEIKEKEISVRLMPNSNVEDLLTAISLEMDIPTISESEEVSQGTVYIPNYSGKLTNLLDMISATKDISFDYKNGTIVAKESSSYVITLPQDKELLDTVSEELANIGARNVQSSVSSGFNPRALSNFNLTFINF